MSKIEKASDLIKQESTSYFNYLSCPKTGYMNRRDFIGQTSVLAAGALILPNSLFAFQQNPIEKVRIGFIAVGFRGQTHIAEML